MGWRFIMTEATKTSWNYVWVKDRAGNEFICPSSALKDPKKASPEELDKCVDDASAGVPLGD
jgi:hypothetical protein